MAGTVSRAVAGGGKTTRLVEQYLQEVVFRESPLDPSNVVVITFTEAAARELMDRIREALSEEVSTTPRAGEVLDNLGSAPIGTIHSFARRVLLRNAAMVGVPFNVEVLDELDPALEELLKRRVRRRYQEFRAQFAIQDRHTQRENSYGRAVYLQFDAQGLIKSVSGALLRQPEWATCSAKDVRAMEDQAWQHFADLHQPPAGVLTAEEARATLRSVKEQLAIGAANASKESVAAAFEKLLAMVDGVLSKVEVLAATEPVTETLKPGRSLWVTKVMRAACDSCGIPDYPELADRLSAHEAAVKPWLADLKATYARVAGLLAVEAYLSIRDAESRDWLLQDELLQRCWALLGDDTVSAAMRAQYPVIFLDEAQDVDATQRMMLLKIAGPDGLVVVGDPQQSIYGFRGADYATFDILQREVCGDREPQHLSTTFRSQPPIVEAVNAVFVDDPHHTPLQTNRADEAGSVTFLNPVPVPVPSEWDPATQRHPKSPDYQRAQADAVADRIVALLSSGTTINDKRLERERPLRASDIAILVGGRGPVSSFEAALKARGVGVCVRTSRDMARHPLAEGLAAALLAIIDPADSRALLIALRSPLFACRDDELTAHVLGESRKLRLRWEEQTSGPVSDAMGVLRAGVEVYRRQGAAAALAGLLRDCEVPAVLAELPDSAQAWAEIRLMMDLVADRQRAVVETDHEFVAWFTEQIQSGGKTNSKVLDEISGDDVTITTVHQAKGLEWPVVVVAGFASEKDSKTGLQFGDADVYTRLNTKYAYMPEVGPDPGGLEENRLLYVAMTRARDHLIVSGVAYNSSKSASLARAQHLRDSLAGLATVEVVEVPVHVGHGAAQDPVRLAPGVIDVSGPGDVSSRLAEIAIHAAQTLRREVPSDHAPAEPGSATRVPASPDVQSAVLGELVHGVLERVDFAELVGFSGSPVIEELLTVVAPTVGAGEPEVAAARALLRDVGSSKTLQRASVAGIVRREIPISGNRLAEDGTLLVTQGIIDLLFSEGHGSWVLADYKTDSTDRTEAEFIGMYRGQLLAYRRLLAEVGVRVDETWLVRLRPGGVEDVLVVG